MWIQSVEREKILTFQWRNLAGPNHLNRVIMVKFSSEVRLLPCPGCSPLRAPPLCGVLLLNPFNSVTQSCLTLRPHGLQCTRPPHPSPTPRVYSNSCPLSWWCHPTISSSLIPFSSRIQSFPASGSFPVSQLFTSGGQSIGVSASASVLPMNIQDWFPLA